MKAYQLHDSETEEILGTVLLTSEADEVFEAWTDYNKLEEHELDHKSVEQFVKWVNENYLTQIEELEVDFIQP